MKMRVIVYAMHGCCQCRVVENVLKRNDILFEERDGKELIGDSRFEGASMPVMFIDDNYYIGAEECLSALNEIIGE